MKKIVNLIFLVFIFLLSVIGSVYAANENTPSLVCKYLTDEGFKGSLRYKKDLKTGTYSCSSLRKPIDRGEPLGSDLKYRVSGTASEVKHISLTLRMNSFKVSTPVLREFKKTASVIYQKKFGENLPEKISKAMLSAVRGEWVDAGYRFQLKRIHDKARVYELVFNIENME